MFAINVIIGRVTKVLWIKIIIKSFKLTGILEPSNKPPTSDMYISWVTDVAAIINLVISLSIEEAKTDGINISANPTTNVWEACTASGILSNSKRGIKAYQEVGRMLYTQQS